MGIEWAAQSRDRYWVGYLDALKYVEMEAGRVDDLDGLRARIVRRRSDIDSCPNDPGETW